MYASDLILVCSACVCDSKLLLLVNIEYSFLFEKVVSSEAIMKLKKWKWRDLTKFDEIWRNLANFRRTLKFHRLKLSFLLCDSSLKTRSSLDDILETQSVRTQTESYLCNHVQKVCPLTKTICTWRTRVMERKQNVTSKACILSCIDFRIHHLIYLASHICKCRQI